MSQEPKKIKQRPLIRIFKDVKEHKSEEIRFCFLLGAGSSKSSGISTGWELAEEWYKDLQEDLEPEELKEWEEEISFDEKRVGEFYTHLYQKRYESSPQVGYEKFKTLMENKEPGIGYVILAQVLAHERHNFVITTNFDYLVEDAVRMYTSKKPFSAGHETLAGFISSQTERPTIIKVHRDLFLHPFNDKKETNTLKKEWAKTLRPILKDFNLLVIGYGGNDGSLMDYLAEINAEDRKAIYWCKREQDGLSDKVEKLLKNKDFIVTIDGFDELMYGLYGAYDYHIFEELDKPEEHPFVQDAKRRIDKLNTKRNDILKQLKEKDKTEDTYNIKSLFKGGASEYQYKVAVEEDIDEQEKIHLEGTEKYPNDASLLNNYGNYLCDNKRYEEAFEKYEKAIEIKPNLHQAFNNWGTALGNLAETKTGEAAEKLYHQAFEKYKKAIDIKPDNYQAFTNWGMDLGGLARTKSGKEADALYQQAFDEYQTAVLIKPDYDEAFYNWGVALGKLADTKTGEAAEKLYRQAIEKYKKAIEIKPDFHEAFYNWGMDLGNLADTETGEAAETLYLQAVEKFQKAIEIKPDYSKAFYNLGSAFLELAKTKSGKEAKILLQEALEKSQKAVDLGGSKYNLACAYALLSDKENALLYLEQSLESKDITTDFILQDEDWQAYFEDKAFQKLIKKYSKK